MTYVKLTLKNEERSPPTFTKIFRLFLFFPQTEKMLHRKQNRTLFTLVQKSEKLFSFSTAIQAIKQFHHGIAMEGLVILLRMTQKILLYWKSQTIR